MNADNKTFIFHVWNSGDLTLKKLTLQNGNNPTTGGGAIYCAGGKLTADDVLIENCKAKYGGGVYIDAQASRVGTFKMEGSATVTPSTEGDANVPGKNDVYLADASNGNGGYNEAKIIVTDTLDNTSVARLTMRHDAEPLASGYIAGRQVVKGIKSDDDALKFKVTPQRVFPPVNLKNWRLEHIISGSGEHIGILTSP